jgi:hypothetical protein
MTLSTKLTKDTVISQTPGLIAAELDGQKVMMSIENGKYYNLDKVGSRIWELIEKPQKVQDVVAELLVEYEVDVEQCQADVLTFLEKMAREGLISIA